MFSFNRDNLSLKDSFFCFSQKAALLFFKPNIYFVTVNLFPYSFKNNKNQRKMNSSLSLVFGPLILLIGYKSSTK